MIGNVRLLKVGEGGGAAARFLSLTAGSRLLEAECWTSILGGMCVLGILVFAPI